ncbi:VOC family protein [Oceanobacillus chungangensis]|uniref:Glyoxalase/bleomycin resistance/extradiol dioxygenase family protein n=1 Tax=Oceanobacillus chungangensis TaxID=1229152 RepID=A0A3D8PWK3_9BACI|nr:VOC family protein [Oceanobacillus chungangensis]RDW19701.1 glyoxalase/bleomycin resistance/extradiol dioxygenase family protein [Oceanobacillus chungangensis]
MAFKSKNIFINLPVKDVKNSTKFLTEIGFELNPQFSDENTSSIIINDNIFALIMNEDRFKEFSKKEIVDTATASEAIFCLSAESREQVDELVNKAISAGGKTYNEPQDHGFMYGWGFQDLDGHIWEVVYMDESAF